MKYDLLEKIVKGYFVAAYSSTADSTEACEVALEHSLKQFRRRKRKRTSP